MNGKNNSFKDSDFDQAILDIKVPKDLIAFCGFRMLKKVPTVAFSLAGIIKRYVFMFFD